MQIWAYGFRSDPAVETRSWVPDRAVNGTARSDLPQFSVSEDRMRSKKLPQGVKCSPDDSEGGAVAGLLINVSADSSAAKSAMRHPRRTFLVEPA